MRWGDGFIKIEKIVECVISGCSSKYYDNDLSMRLITYIVGNSYFWELSILLRLLIFFYILCCWGKNFLFSLVIFSSDFM